MVFFLAHLSSVVCQSVRPSVNFSHFHHLLQNYSANFNQTWHNVYMDKADSSLSREDNWEIIKINWQLLKIFFSKTTGPILTGLSTNYTCVKGIQVCSNEGPRPFQRGDNWEKIKINWQLLKIFLSRTTGPISTKLAIKHSWVKMIQVFFSKWRVKPFSKWR